MHTQKKITLGTMQFLWTCSEKEAYEVLDAYFSLGGRAIDTADMYTNWANGCRGGEAETIIGKWLRGKDRQEIMISTKVRSRMWEGPDGEGLSKKHIQKACDDSLRRSQTDYIDIYFAHWPDPMTPLEETVEAFSLLYQQGKIRAMGCSNYDTHQVEQLIQLSQEASLPFTAVQDEYSLLKRNTAEQMLFPLLTKTTVSFFAYSPLGGGILTETFSQKKVSHARTTLLEVTKPKQTNEVIQALQRVAKDRQKTMAQIALRWVIEQDSVSGCIIGADTGKQVETNLKALDFSLSEDEQKLLSEASGYLSSKTTS